MYIPVIYSELYDALKHMPNFFIVKNRLNQNMNDSIYNFKVFFCLLRTCLTHVKAPPHQCPPLCSKFVNDIYKECASLNNFPGPYNKIFTEIQLILENELRSPGYLQRKMLFSENMLLTKTGEVIRQSKIETFEE